MKRKYVYGSIAAIVLGVASYQMFGTENTVKEKKDYQVAYVGGKKSARVKASANKEKTPDQVSAEEGIDAEQIVVKITDKGYVTSHGDHYHFFNGKVPYDAILSEELIINDPNYVFQESDVVSEVLDGYIIKVNGNYYLYLKPGSKRKNIRSRADIEEQRRKWANASATHHQLSASDQEQVAQAKAAGRYTTDDGYIFSPTDIIDDLGDAYLVPHGNHFHYIPKSALSPSELAAAQAYWSQKNGGTNTYGGGYNPSPVIPSIGYNPSQNYGNSDEPEWQTLLRQLYALPLSQRYTEEDGLVFDPAQIVRRLSMGVVVPHGDHFHVIPYAKMSPLEARLAYIIPIGAQLPQANPTPKTTPAVQRPQTPKTTTPVQNPKTTTPTQNPKPNTPTQKKIMLHFQGKTFPAVKKGLDGKPYFTSDGYVFTPESIYSVDTDGITAVHGNHTHFVPFDELEQYELDQVAAWLVKKNTPTMTIDELEQKIEELWEKADPITNITIRSSFEDQLRDLEQRLSDVKEEQSTESLAAIQADYEKLAKAIQTERDNPTPADQSSVKKTAKEIYDEVTPAKLMPVEAIPWHMHQTVEIKEGHIFVIPHTDHYHNIKMEWFDQGLYSAPEGYTLEQLFATVKYYVLHPEERPKEAGWGSDSDYGRGLSESVVQTESESASVLEETQTAALLSAETQSDEVTAEPTEESVDTHNTAGETALEERLQQVTAFINNMADSSDKAAYSATAEILLKRFSALSQESNADSLAAIQAEVENLARTIGLE